MNQNRKPELLSPAGDLERLQAALDYGADAVYLAGKAFGMRSAPANFTNEELREGVRRAHARGARVYVTCNTLPRNTELAALPDFLTFCEEIGVDAFIVTDLGVLALAKRYAPKVAVHISTQAGIVNFEAARAFYDLGAERVVLARELSFPEIAEIRARTPATLEIEAFVHGAMCVSFSGRCLLSNYLTGRDANRGDCAQPCRWDYYLVERTRPDQPFVLRQEDKTSYVLNSKDMCMIEHIPELIRCGISSFKIEGRAKSAYYVACVTNAYRHAIDAVLAGTPIPPWVVAETDKISHRVYSTGFYSGNEPGQTPESGGYIRNWDIAAICIGEENGLIRLSQRNRFFRGETVSVLEPGAEPYAVTLDTLYNEAMEPIESAPHATMTVYLKTDRKIRPGAFLRVRRG